MRAKTERRIKPYLDELVKTAEEFIAGGNEHVPQLITLNIKGNNYIADQILLVPTSNDDYEKDIAAQVMGQIVEPYDAYIHLMEAWMVKLKRDEVCEVRPSQHPKRIEQFIIHFVTKLGEQLWQTWDIIRPPDGKPYLANHYSTEQPNAGRFANFYEYTMPADKEKPQ